MSESFESAYQRNDNAPFVNHNFSVYENGSTKDFVEFRDANKFMRERSKASDYKGYIRMINIQTNESLLDMDEKGNMREL